MVFLYRDKMNKIAEAEEYFSKLEIDENCDAAQYFLRLLPFYAITFSLNIGIVLSAYYLNKLAKKSIYFFRALILPPFILLIDYTSQYGNELLRAFSL